MTMTVVNASFPGIPDLTRHYESRLTPRPAVCVVLTVDDCGLYAAYEGIILVNAEFQPVKENGLELVATRGRKLRVERAVLHFPGCADKYRS